MPGTSHSAVATCAGVALVACALVGCPQYGVVDDGTSVSHGPSNHGVLLRPARLPARGTGYEIPDKWRRRGLSYGTDELVTLIVHTGRRVAGDMPGVRLQIADLSPRRGGPSAWHRSHQSGRDVDILFLAHDAAGRPVAMADMIHFRDDGAAALAGAGGELESQLFFDVARNWELVRALMANSVAEVQYIFIFDPLRQLLLDYARRAGEPEELVLQAGALLRQPGDSAPHDDHMHVRIYCAATDRAAGCRDRGLLRWTKKDYKYGGAKERARPAHSSATAALQQVLQAPLPAMMVMGVFPRLP